MPLRFLFFACLALPAPAQQAAPQETTLQTLLNEVHVLRLAIEKSNQLGPRIQIALARMQFQEQRVREAERQAQAAHEEVVRVQNIRARMESHIKENENSSQVLDPGKKTRMEAEVTVGNAELKLLDVQEPQLRAREAEANSVLNGEQAKLNEINDLLASIERALK